MKILRAKSNGVFRLITLLGVIFCMLVTALAENNVDSYTLDINEGNITIGEGTTSGTLKVSYGSTDMDNIQTAQEITIVGNGSTNNTISVQGGVAANITLSNVTIDVSDISDACAFQITGKSTVNLTLIGISNLSSGEDKAGIQVGSENKLTINGDGTLNAIGGDYASGIGSSSFGSAGKIIINSGTVNATGGAGIGGNDGVESDFGSEIIINGGTVKATGNYYGVGIGVTEDTNAGEVTINGGTVEATGGKFSAGISAGGNWQGGKVTITGGTVKAIGGIGGAGIGGGQGSSGGEITISGGIIAATGNGGAAGIGGGAGWDGGTIKISGGTIYSEGEGDAEDIGNGRGDWECSVEITGGSVYPVRGESYITQPTNGNGDYVYLHSLAVSDGRDGVALNGGNIDGIAMSTAPDAANGVYGIKDVVTMNGGKVCFWLKSTPSNITWEYDGSTLNKAGTETTHEAYISGYIDGTFRPDSSITRAETAQLLYNISSAKGSSANKFSDVSSDKWYYNAVTNLTDSGVISGYNDGTFKPINSISRAEFVTLVVRYAEKKTEASGSSFSDVSSDHWAVGYIAAATQVGYISGYTDGTFRPRVAITRAEAVTVLNAMLGRDVDKDALASLTMPFSDVPTSHWAYNQILEAAVEHAHSEK